LLITFSGIDGSGKSANIATLTSWLTGAGLRVRTATLWDNVVVLPRLREKLTRKLFRGETGVGAPEPVQRRDKNLHPRYATLGRYILFLLDAIHLRWLAKQMLSAEADVIIFDRYLYDQLAILPIQQRTVRIYARLLCKLVLRPDIAYLLDADPEAAFIRKLEYPLEFLKQYRRSYLLVREFVEGITVRRAISRLSTWITVPLQKPGIRLSDPLSGFFMLRRSSITGVRLQPEGFKLLPEILVRRNILSVSEIPYHFGLRYAGKSKVNLRVGLDYLQLLGRLSRSAFSRSAGSS
jgi:thymidylate kinase